MPDDPQSSVPDTGHDRHFDTIVIGAGIAGLACANRLQQKLPHSRITVLEARDRIGGRINAVRKSGSRLDTGANWIHGIGTKDEPNPLMDILHNKRYRQIRGGVMFRPPPKDSGAGDKENLMVPRDSLAMLMDAMWGMIGELHQVSYNTPADEAKATTLLHAMQNSELFQDAFSELPAKYRSTLSGMPQFIENMEAAPLVASSAEAPYTKPGVSLLEYAIDDFDGDQVFLQDGYTPIIEELAKPLYGAGAIETEAEVEAISWSDDPIITVQTSREVYRAKRIVLTIPLGVLKERHESIFQPALPPSKQEAITSLGFGTLDKVFLVYSHAWWAEEPYQSFFKQGKRLVANSNNDLSIDSDIDTFMGFTHALSGLSITPNKPPSPGPRLLSFINLHALTAYPVLGVFTSCSNALKLESMSDADAGAFVHSTFTSWLPAHLPTPPKPEAVHVTRWAQDEFSRGSYSHMITGVSERRHREEFATPLRNGQGAEVRWAGEHTSEDHFATAHGALISGWREADAIVATGT
jgi:monoamine oxidase